MVVKIKGSHPSGLLPCLLIAGGTSIIQYHSIAFWSTHVDTEIGWGWSIMIEASGLWLWFYPSLPRRILGLLASILLLTGPLYQIGSPVLDLMSKSTVNQSIYSQKIMQLKTQRKQDAQLLLTYAHNSKSRIGWLRPIQELRSRMDKTQEQLDALNTSKRAQVFAESQTGVTLVILLQAAGIVLLQISNVLAITYLSKQYYQKHYGFDSSKQIKSKLNDEFVQLRMVAHGIRSWMQREDLSISKSAQKLNVDRHNLAYLINWSKPGDRMPSAESMNVLSGHL